MVVLTLVERGPDSDTVSILQALLSKALRGEIIGTTVCYRLRNGSEEAVYSGVHWNRPAEALRAALRVSVTLTNLEEETRGPP